MSAVAEHDVTAAERVRRDRVRRTLTHLSRTGDLPVLPHAATAALALARTPDADAERLCDVIRTDVGLAARILRVANSTAYVRRTPARSIAEAVLALGLRKTCDVLVAACFRQMYTASGPYAESLWNHALASAIATEELARVTRAVAPSAAFLPGLFHDVGRIAFLLADPTSAEVIQGLVDAGGGERGALEREWYGFDHAEAGGVLAADWGLEPAACDAIRCHHDPMQAAAGRQLAILLSAADALVYSIGFGTGAEPPRVDVSDALGLSADDRTSCAERVARTFATECELFA
jgi:HD-like signal output (HDOD) protein